MLPALKLRARARTRCTEAKHRGSLAPRLALFGEIYRVTQLRNVYNASAFEISRAGRAEGRGAMPARRLIKPRKKCDATSERTEKRPLQKFSLGLSLAGSRIFMKLNGDEQEYRTMHEKERRRDLREGGAFVRNERSSLRKFSDFSSGCVSAGSQIISKSTPTSENVE